MKMTPELGIIEGFYGRPWSWADRRNTVAHLKTHGYGFYLYAPKADVYLRLRWREDYPADAAALMKQFARTCKGLGVRFGIGLSPVLHNAFDDRAKDALQRKLSFFDDVGADDIAILFDDMTGADDSLAKLHVEVVHWAAARTKASRVIMCPSYYTDDPVLDRVFGKRPHNYERDLGAGLDRKIEIFWTGEEVVSRQFTKGHLERVADTFKRKPFLWDNYPVNDGARMSQYLHVRGFTGRPSHIADNISAHGVNPALQPALNIITCMTLPDSYNLGKAYEYGRSMKNAAQRMWGEELGEMLYDDVLFLQDVGLDRLGDKAAMLRARYKDINQPPAHEIIRWLDGEYRITDELVRAMAGNDQG